MGRLRAAIPVATARAAAALGIAFFLIPLVALAARAPWSAAPDIVREPAVRTALRLSLICSLSATGLALALGVPLAWLLARVEFPGREVVRTVRSEEHASELQSR